MKRFSYFSLVLVWLALFLSLSFWPSPPPSLEVDFLDVGQGDAALIKTPYGQSILIDGGPDSGILEELAAHLPFLERKIDLVILTHQHEDHLAGLLDVFKRYEVGKVIYSSASGSPAMAEAWLKALSEEGAEVEKPSEQERVLLGASCELRIINPAYFYSGKDLNEYSLVLILDCGRRVIFMGDAGKPVEDWLLKKESDLSAEVLKVGHHGSLSASSEAFLKAVAPAWAVVSAGKGNRYGLPKAEIVRRLQRLGIGIRRTDTEGSIKIIWAGP
jgi:competence protein ComEC